MTATRKTSLPNLFTKSREVSIRFAKNESCAGAMANC